MPKRQAPRWAHPLFPAKPVARDPREDPSVVEWEDGRLMQRDAQGGWRLISGPTPQQQQSKSDSEFEALITWTPIVAKFLVVVFTLLGILAFVSMVSGREIGCKSVNDVVNCFVILPHR